MHGRHGRAMWKYIGRKSCSSCDVGPLQGLDGSFWVRCLFTEEDTVRRLVCRAALFPSRCFDCGLLLFDGYPTATADSFSPTEDLHPHESETLAAATSWVTWCTHEKQSSRDGTRQRFAVGATEGKKRGALKAMLHCYSKSFATRGTKKYTRLPEEKPPNTVPNIFGQIQATLRRKRY